jgi:hypothetical protein
LTSAKCRSHDVLFTSEKSTLASHLVVEIHQIDFLWKNVSNVEMFRQNFQEMQVDIYVSKKVPSFSLKNRKKFQVLKCDLVFLWNSHWSFSLTFRCNKVILSSFCPRLWDLSVHMVYFKQSLEPLCNLWTAIERVFKIAIDSKNE